jgi:hypothetical protein
MCQPFFELIFQHVQVSSSYINEDETAKMDYERLDEDKTGGLRSLLQKRKRV